MSGWTDALEEALEGVDRGPAARSDARRRADRAFGHPPGGQPAAAQAPNGSMPKTLLPEFGVGARIRLPMTR
jgi:hypothetical protein